MALKVSDCQAKKTSLPTDLSEKPETDVYVACCCLASDKADWQPRLEISLSHG